MRVALVGIDGTGKTTVLRRLRERDGVRVVHAVRGHEDPDSPYAGLSAALAGASSAADEVGRVQLKVCVLYLQLCLFGPAERQAAADGGTVLADRHPLVDPLVYLPLFARAGGNTVPGTDVDAWWRRQDPDAARAVRDWLRARTGDTDPWATGTEVLRWGTLAPHDLFETLARRFDVTLPDGVLLLDLPVSEALRRTRERARGGELHETAAFLSATRQRYDAVLDGLSRTHPDTAIRRLPCAGCSVDELAARVHETVAAWSRHHLPDRTPS